MANLKNYVSEVGRAKTQADLDKASNVFAGFLKTGGKEAADAIGVVAGAAGAPSKLLGREQDAYRDRGENGQQTRESQRGLAERIEDQLNARAQRVG